MLLKIKVSALLKQARKQVEADQIKILSGQKTDNCFMHQESNGREGF